MMSSATSINGTEPLPAPAVSATSRDDPSTSSGSSRARSRDDTFRPWHFFVLLSLVAATVAVVLAREARPEHLVLVSLTIGAAGFAAGTLYRTLAPLFAKPSSETSGPLSGSTRALLERDKLLVLRSIKELEFDRAMKKVSARDFDEMAGRLRARAMSLMRQLDADAGYRELIEREVQARLATGKTLGRDRQPAPSAPVSVAPAPAAAVCGCGTSNDADAAFCKRCGLKLAGSTR
jgi:hypothetical protein